MFKISRLSLKVKVIAQTSKLQEEFFKMLLILDTAINM